MIGQTISHFKILEKLGEGGMGVVYKAQDTKLDRLVALKFLPHHLTREETERARFLQEAKAAATLNHPNICTIHGIEEADGQQFIEMEFVDGVTLREKIPVEKQDSAVGYAIQIGEALEEAHAKGVVHRDIKADNIMVNLKNQIKVMDFGLAKLKGSLKLTRTSSTVGTLAYMAPEQIQGGEVDFRSDIFSFAIVLYEMLTGKFPFKGEHEAAIMYSILNEEPDPIQKYREDLSPELIHIINRALEKDPAERYQSVSDMLIDLRRVKKQSTKITRTSAFQVPSSPLAPAVEKEARKSSFASRKSVLISIGIGIIILIALVLWMINVQRGHISEGSYPFHTFTPVRVPTDNQPLLATISPDGKYIIYSVNESEKQSLWMRQVSAASSVRVRPPENVNYVGFTFSPDGDYIYYTALIGNDRNAALFVVPTLGGTPRKVVSDMASAVGISPDGKQIAFIRQYQDEGTEALMLCGVDGSNERRLLSRSGEDFFLSRGAEAPAWSKDGQTIAIAAGSTIGKIHMNVILVSPVDGSWKLATPRRWDSIGHLIWLNGDKGLAMVGSDYLGGVNSQLWYLDLSNGSVRRITNDLSDYNNATLSATEQRSSMLALQQNFSSNVEVLPAGDWRHAKNITSRNTDAEGVGGLDWTPDGRIVYASQVSGSSNIWLMDSDGKNRRQLTSQTNGEYTPSVSANGQLITYSSRSDTTPHVWIMDIDGNNQQRLTTGPDDYLPVFAHDNVWIYFDSYRDKGRRNLWKIKASGGEPVKVMDEYVYSLGISPDGKLYLVREFESAVKTWSFVLISVENGKPVKKFQLPGKHGSGGVGWMPDSKSLAYVDTRDNVSNIWVVPLDSMKPYQLTHFDSGEIVNFNWSKDGKNLALVRGESSSTIVLLNDIR